MYFGADFVLLSDVSWAAFWRPEGVQKLPDGGQEALRRLPGGGGDGAQIDPAAGIRPKRAEHPEKVLSNPLWGPIFIHFSIIFHFQTSGRQISFRFRGLDSRF